MRKKQLSILLLFLLSALAGCARQQLHPAKGPIRIALIDTGVSTTVIDPAFCAEGKNYVLVQADTEDCIGHGTAIASILVGCASADLPGVCRDVCLVPLVYLSQNDRGETIRGGADMMAQAIRDAVDIFSCRIINLSGGVRTDSPALEAAVVYAEQQGVLIVSSAGNDGDRTTYYPAAYDTVLCVGAADEALADAAGFSNCGAFVDLLALGENVPTATMRGNLLLCSGSSYAAAYVTAAAVNLLAEEPSMAAHALRTALCNSATDVGAPGWDETSGWGILKAE